MIQSTLDLVHSRHAGVTDGEVAHYIPELGKAEARLFGIALATVNGDVFETGDSRVEFTIQSISKTFVYALALARLGWDRVAERVGVEPSGEAYNSIELDEKTGRPFNPMVNAGALAATALLLESTDGCKASEFLDLFSAAAGRQLQVDEAVWRSENDTGHRNRAIAHLMRHSGMIKGDVDEVLDTYCKQCSVLVTAVDLAVMAATLANHGVNPVTGEVVLPVSCVQDVQSVLFMCGMYDFAGEWAHRVGMPAKSGVGGGILAVVNRQVGIGVFSPPLDERGSSVRGILACEDLSKAFGLHMFNFQNHGSNFLQSVLDDSAGGR